MNDRLTTLAGALFSLLVFVLLIYQPTPTRSAALPTSIEPGGNGYLGLATWLARNGVATASLRERFDVLHEDFPAPSQAYPGQGHILLTTYPFALDARTDELAALHEWVEAGNTLLVMAALNETPDWANGTAADFVIGLEKLSGLFFEAIDPGNDDTISFAEMLNPGEVVYDLVTSHPLAGDARHLEGMSDLPTSQWQPIPVADWTSPVQIAHAEPPGHGGMWQVAQGNGFIIVSASATLFINRQLDKADNATFMSTLASTHLATDGHVIFDDFHQGLSEIYDPEAFFADDRLHATMFILIAFWLLYLVGNAGRLAKPLPEVSRPEQRELVRALAQFMYRKLSRPTAAQLVIDQWLNDLTRGGKLNAAENPWSQLAAMPLIDRDCLAAIERDYTTLQNNRPVDLTRLQNNVKTLERNLG